MLITVKVFLFVDTNFRGFCKMQWSLGSWIKWTTKSTKIRTPRLNDITVFEFENRLFETMGTSAN